MKHTKIRLGILIFFTAFLAVDSQAQLRTRQAASPPANPPVTDFKNTTVPLKAYPQGEQMLATAAKNAALLDINFKFLDKEYKNDVYTLGVRTSCVRLRVSSGFRMRIDVPEFQLSAQGLVIQQNIARLSAQGISVKWQLGPCVPISAGIGVSMSDINFVYKARPMLAFDGKGYCRLTWNQGPDPLRASIGGLNITGVQNNLDKLAKDAFREGLNFTLDGAYGSLIRNEVNKLTVSVCGEPGALRTR